MTLHPPRTDPPAFTFIELLVVIALLLIFAALLYPFEMKTHRRNRVAVEEMFLDVDPR
jgi:prepilin-type N-terminal cleavage/methylation domain-containing protein